MNLIQKIRNFFDFTWKSRRLKEVRNNLIFESGAKFPNAPHIISGTYYWKHIPDDIKLDIFFPNLPSHGDKAFAVVVAPRNYVRFSESSTVINRRTWKTNISHTSFNVRACRLAKVPVLFIAPDDPIDPDSLALAADEAFVLNQVII